MQGALSFASSQYDVTTGFYIIQGIPDQYGNSTRFLDDISVGLDGSYSDIQFTTVFHFSFLINLISVSGLLGKLGTNITENL